MPKENILSKSTVKNVKTQIVIYITLCGTYMKMNELNSAWEPDDVKVT